MVDVHKKNLDRQKPLLDKIKDGHFKDYLVTFDYNKLRNTVKNPSKKDVAVVCIDEGVHISLLDGEDKYNAELNIAGSGILNTPELAARHFFKLITRYDLSIDVITSHDNCGAAELAGIDDVIGWTQQTVKILNQMLREEYQEGAIGGYKEVSHKHIEDDRMARGDEHTATMIIFNINKYLFSPRLLLDEKGASLLPDSFVINSYYNNNNEVFNDNPIAQLKVALDIALGNHGIGFNNFADDYKLQLIIAGSKVNYNEFRERINNLLSSVFVGSGKPYGDYVEVQFIGRWKRILREISEINN